MPLDAICLSGVVSEVRAALTGLRVEKVQQPARDQIVLSFRGSRRIGRSFSSMALLYHKNLQLTSTQFIQEIQLNIVYCAY